MFLIDSHCHLDGLDYNDRDLTQVLATALDRDVKHCLSVATSLSGFEAMEKWLAPYANMVSLSCGVHPLNLDDEPFDADKFLQLASQSNVVALGETGLDYYYQTDNIDLQQQVFIEHIHLGRSLKKPLIVHTRQAKQDTLMLLKQEQAYSGVI